jgi:hypothetical protein
LLAIVAGLFLLSLLAPFGWNRSIRLATKHLGKTSGMALLPVPMADDWSAIVLTGGSEPTVNPHSDIRHPQSTAPQVAPLGPLVADQIDLDPSITQTPALPAQPAAGLAFGPLTVSDPTYTADQELTGPIAEPSPSATIEREPAPEPELPQTKAWPYPAGLIEQLNILAAEVPAAAAWAQEVNAVLNRSLGWTHLPAPRPLLPSTGSTAWPTRASSLQSPCPTTTSARRCCGPALPSSGGSSFGI